MTTAEKRKAIEDFLRSYGQGTYLALHDYLAGTLENTREFLETAKDVREIYQAQGQVEILRKIIKDLTPPLKD